MKRGVVIFVYLLCLCGCQKNGQDNPLEQTLSRHLALQDFKAFRYILEASHPSLHIYSSEKKLTAILDSVSNSIKDEISIAALFNKYYYVVNEIGCAHTYLDLPARVYDSLLNRKFFFPLPVKLIDGRLLVNATAQAVPEGTEILGINGRPVEKILNDLTRYESAEGLHRSAQTKMAAESFALDYFYAYGKSSVFNIELKDTAGAEQTLNNVAATTLSDWYDIKSNFIYYYDAVQSDFDLKVREQDGYAIMQMRTFSYATGEKQDAFENFVRNSFELLSLKKNIHTLIVDVRENTGGDLYNSCLLFSYLARESFSEYQSASSKLRSVKYPEYLDDDFIATRRAAVDERLAEEFTSNAVKGFMMADSFIYRWEPNKFAFRGKLYVVTNARVASAASYFSVMVKNSGVGKIVGEETNGGSFSGNAFENLPYILPYSKLKLVFPYGHIIYTYKDKRNTGRGLIPDYEVPDDYESFRLRQDRQIRFICDSLMQKK